MSIGTDLSCTVPIESDAPSYKLLGPRYYTNLSETLKNISEFREDKESFPIICFDCGQISYVSPDIERASCRHCGVEMQMKDYIINQNFRELAIRTQGMVEVETGTQLSGSSIMCRKMVMDGWISAQIFCWGELSINVSGSFEYTVQAQYVRVKEGEKVTFFRTLRAKNIHIAGEVTGNIICEGSVTLAPGAVLTGDVVAGKLEVDSKAKHKGQYRVSVPVLSNSQYSPFYMP